MYAIQNTKTGKFVFGTDHRYPVNNRGTRRQRTSCERMLTYEDYPEAKAELLARRCGKDYKVVVLGTIKVKRVID